MDKLENDLGIAAIVKIRQHSNPNDDLYTKESGERGKLYEQKAFPTIAFNGLNITRRGMTEKEIDDAVKGAWSMATVIKMTLGGGLKQEAAGTKLEFEAFATQVAPMGQANLKYAFFLFEDNIEREDQFFQHVIRGIKPGAKGISTRLTPDTPRRLTASFDLNEKWVKDELGCVCAIFDSDTMEVFAYGAWLARAPHPVSGILPKWDAAEPLVVTFDRDIDKATFGENTILLVDKGRNTVSGKSAVNGATCTFTPNAPLSPDGNYTLYLRGGPNGIKTVRGTSLVDHAVYQFTAEESKPKPVLSIEKTTLDFGDIVGPSMMLLEIKNTGPDVLSGVAVSTVTWLKAEPSSFEIPAGGSKEIIVTVETAGLESGTYQGKIEIATNGGKFVIPVSFKYEKKEYSIAATPNVLDFGLMVEGTKKTLSFTLEVEGSSGLLKGTCKSLQDWIKIEPSSFECEDCSFKVTASPTGQGELAGDVAIETNLGTIKIPVKARLGAAKPLSMVITNPALGLPAKTQTSSFTINGTTSPGATVTVGGKPTTVDQAGKFTAVMSLAPGQNKFEIMAKNAKGETAKASVEIVYEITVELWLDKLDIKINGKTIALVTAPTTSSPPLPQELKGNTYMPIREVAEALGASVGFEAATKKVTLTQNLPGGQKVVELWINKTMAKINGMDVQIHSSGKLYPTIVGGKTLLPLRFVGEALGASVGWSQAEKKITLVYPK